jgi:multiple sugar transport system substrate-binding protein
MKRVAAAVGLIAALAVTAGLAASPTQAGKKTAVTPLTIWVGWSAGTELISFKKLIAEYVKQHKDVSVKVVGGINDDKIIAALRAGNAPDVVSSFQSNNVGVYCPSGGWIDLGPYLKRDHVDVNQFPAGPRYYTAYKGIRCALPLLADTYGLYYNKTLFKQAGIKAPPKTFSELVADAK